MIVVVTIVVIVVADILWYWRELSGELQASSTGRETETLRNEETAKPDVVCKI